MFATKTQGTPFVTAKLAIKTVITRVFFFFIVAHACVEYLVNNKFSAGSILQIKPQRLALSQRAGTGQGNVKGGNTHPKSRGFAQI